VLAPNKSDSTANSSLGNATDKGNSTGDLVEGPVVMSDDNDDGKNTTVLNDRAMVGDASDNNTVAEDQPVDDGDNVTVVNDRSMVADANDNVTVAEHPVYEGDNATVVENRATADEGDNVTETVDRVVLLDGRVIMIDGDGNVTVADSLANNTDDSTSGSSNDTTFIPDSSTGAEETSPAASNITAATPTLAPTALPALTPTNIPTLTPTNVPTLTPTNIPTKKPSNAPTRDPSAGPTMMPSLSPSVQPTAKPSISPTGAPSTGPTTATPTEVPTVTSILLTKRIRAVLHKSDTPKIMISNSFPGDVANALGISASLVVILAIDDAEVQFELLGAGEAAPAEALWRQLEAMTRSQEARLMTGVVTKELASLESVQTCVYLGDVTMNPRCMAEVVVEHFAKAAAPEVALVAAPQPCPISAGISAQPAGPSGGVMFFLGLFLGVLLTLMGVFFVRRRQSQRASSSRKSLAKKSSRELPGVVTSLPPPAFSTDDFVGSERRKKAPTPRSSQDFGSERIKKGPTPRISPRPSTSELQPPGRSSRSGQTPRSLQLPDDEVDAGNVKLDMQQLGSIRKSKSPNQFGPGFELGGAPPPSARRGSFLPGDKVVPPNQVGRARSSGSGNQGPQRLALRRGSAGPLGFNLAPVGPVVAQTRSWRTPKGESTSNLFSQ
jgi:hypothetical protein